MCSIVSALDGRKAQRVDGGVEERIRSRIDHNTSCGIGDFAHGRIGWGSAWHTALVELQAFAAGLDERSDPEGVRILDGWECRAVFGLRNMVLALRERRILNGERHTISGLRDVT